MLEPFPCPPSRSAQVLRDRVLFCVLGAAFGAGMWLLGEAWNDPAWPRGTFLAVFAFQSVFSATVLALLGPAPMSRALGGGAAFGLFIALLISFAGQRYPDPIQSLDQAPLLALASVLTFVAIPFLTVTLRDPAQWRRYDLLFETAWSVSARFTLAWLFVGIFWALVLLSDALMSLVGVALIDRLLDTEWLVFTLTGGVLGLGLAVVYELRATLSPFLFLRMLRLLGPLVLMIITLFLIALPLRGLTNLFGGVSSAGTLMSVCFAAIALISIAVDRNNAEAVSTRGLRLSTRALALVQPALAGLALWAVILRVSQYGWTPDRVLGMGAAILLTLYSMGYAASAAIPGAWMGRIRAVNVALAFAVMGFCAVWMTPLLNAEKISVNSQITRFQDGRLDARDLAYWSMQHDWGKAGQAGLAQLEALTDHPDAALVAQTIAVARSQTDRYNFEQSLTDQRAPEELARLIAQMPVQPSGAVLTVELLLELPDFRRTQWLDGCARQTPEGGPGCVMLNGPYLPVNGTQAMVLFLDVQGRARAHHLWIDSDGDIRVQDAHAAGRSSWPDLPASAIAAAQAGQFELRPREGVALHISGQVLEATP